MLVRESKTLGNNVGNGSKLDYQENSERIQKNSELNKERERLVRSELIELRVMRDFYRSQFLVYKSHSQELKSKLDKILSAYPELAEI